MNPNQLVYIKCHNFDKYGRLVLENFLSLKITVNQMIINGYGIPYDGGTKLKII